MTVIHLAQATLELESPGGVTAPEIRDPGSVVRPSLPLSRDADGKPAVPATSIAGSLRQAAAPEDRKDLFGHVTRGLVEETTSAASRLWILGTEVTPSARPAERRRTAINRKRGSADAGKLFDRETLPAGSTIDVWLRLDDDEPGQGGDGVLTNLLRAWRPSVGGGRSTGLGRAVVKEVRLTSLNLSDDADMLRWLTEDGKKILAAVDPVDVERPADEEPLFAGEEFDGRLTFRIDDALHIGTGRSTRRHDGTDTAKILRSGDAPLVPGSTWKGALRARVELVLRSVGELGVCSSVSDDGPCGACPVCDAFGWTAREIGDRETVGARGRLLFLDSTVDGGEDRTRHHVAIDRVFGGASRGLLYSDEIVDGGTVTCDLRVDDTLDPAPGAAERGIDPVVRDALVLAFRDLHEGIWGVGHGTTRGYGTLTADKDTERWLEREVPAARDRLRAAVGLPAPTTADAEPEAS